MTVLLTSGIYVKSKSVHMHEYSRADEDPKYPLGYGTWHAPARAFTVIRKIVLTWTPSF